MEKSLKTHVGNFLFVLVIVAVLSSWAGATDPENSDSENQPLKIGLALSGGGAKGIAHLGVLMALEEMGIRVDAIAGTSMGSLVGGLYAAGYSPDQLRELLKSIDWQSVLEDKPPRHTFVFRRKEEDRRTTIDFELGIKNGGFILPSGLSSGNQLKLLLRLLLLEKGHGGEIGDLPLPFSAVATNIETGDVAVLDHGDFTTALRASMALPGIFSPVLWEDHLLSDGGMVRNLPVDVVRAMGVDMVIAVDISKPLKTRAELGSFLAISKQAMGLLTSLNVRKSLEEADIVINPDVGDFDLLDFTPVDRLVELGRIATAQQAEILSQLPRLRSPERTGEPEAQPWKKPFRLGAITIKGLKVNDPKRVFQHINVEEGQMVAYADLQETMHLIAGMEEFEQVDFLFNRKGEAVELRIQVVEKPGGPHYLRFGFEMATVEGGGLELNLNVNQSSHPLNRRGAEWRNNLRIGREYALSSEFYQPLDLGERFFLSADIALNRFTYDIFVENQNLGEGEARSANLNVFLGRQLQNWGELKIGVTRGVLKPRLRKGNVTMINEALNSVVLFGQRVNTAGMITSLKVDLMDHAYIPHRGYTFDLHAYFSEPDLGAEEAYEKLEVRYLQFAQRGRHVFMGGMDYGTAFGGTLPIYDSFRGGGTTDFSGLREGEISGSYKGIVSAGYFRDFPKAKNRSMLGGWLDVGNYWGSSDQVDWDDLLFGANLLYGRETKVGPVYLGVGLTEGGHAQVFLAVGRLFR